MRCSIDESQCAFECGRFQRAPLPHRPETSPGFGAAPRATEHHCAGLRGEAIASADLGDERVEAFQDAHHLRRGPFTVAA